jgi:hypothetical protein
LAEDIRLADHTGKLQTLPLQQSYIHVAFPIKPTFALENPIRIFSGFVRRIFFIRKNH